MNNKNKASARIETQPQPLTFRASFQPLTFDAERRTVELVWTTGAKGRRRDWNGEYFEELEVSERAVRLDRLNNGAPLLAVHNSRTLDAVIGVVERAWIANGEGRAIVRFSERPDANEIMQEVADGILQNISVGYEVHKYERIRSVGEDGKPDGGIDTYRAIDWEPLELSIVPIAFDDGAKVRSAERANNINTRGKTTMKNNNETDTGETIEDANALPLTREARAAVRAERTRVATILELTRRAGLGEGFADALIAGAVPLAEARAAIIDEMAETQQRIQPNTRGQLFDIGVDFSAPEHVSRSIGEAIYMRMNAQHQPSEAARPYVGRSLVELARECLHIRGVPTRSMSHSMIVDRALGYHGTSDFSLALGDAVGRDLMRAFESADAGVVRIARPVSATDFRNRYPISIGDAPSLVEVNEHGEFKSGSIVESSQPAWKLKTFGRIFSITRQALINDDLGAFADVPQQFGIAAREFESAQVVSLLTSAAGAGPTMGSGSPLFHSTHGNLASVGAAISITSLGAARAAMRLQKNLDNRVVNITPKYLVVPAALETVAEQLLTQIHATKAADVNPIKLELVVDPRLDAASSLRWYLAGDQNRGGLEVAHLAGSEGPIVETKNGFEVDGVSFKVRLDFGCGFTDFRTWYQNPGASPEGD
jgi:phage major head subunit gpT-like protein